MKSIIMRGTKFDAGYLLLRLTGDTMIAAGIVGIASKNHLIGADGLSEATHTAATPRSTHHPTPWTLELLD